jgi:predicted phosphodiesterase
MRYLLLSDVHGNATALEAVLRHARLRRYDKAVFLGDAVGYGPQPNEAVALLMSLEPEISLTGNHEDLLLARADAREVTLYKEEGVVNEIILRHLNELTPEHLAYLRRLEPRATRNGWEATHGGLREPWEYLSTLQKAQDTAPYMSTPLLFVGHTHIPRAFASVSGPEGEMWRTVAFRGESAVYRLPPRARVIFNPGAVGQPRDGLPLPSYAIFDEETRTLEHHRVAYDLLTVQRAMKAKGYPESLIQRLAVGT